MSYEIENARDVATVLAALRFYQAHKRQGTYFQPEFENIATNGGELDSLSTGEIDALCERINS